MGNNCQSCGMPLSKDPNGGGLEADGTRSTQYCSICYEDGAFRHQGVSAQEFQAHCLDALAAKGVPRIMAWIFTRGIPNLPRWKQT
jgi:putative zinc ribbon protein